MTEFLQPPSNSDNEPNHEVPPELDGLDLLMKYMDLLERSRKAYSTYRYMSGPDDGEEDDGRDYNADERRQARKSSDEAEDQLEDFRRSFPDIVRAYSDIRTRMRTS